MRMRWEEGREDRGNESREGGVEEKEPRREEQGREEPSQRQSPGTRARRAGVQSRLPQSLAA